MANGAHESATQPKRDFKVNAWQDLLHVLEVVAIIIGGFWVAYTWDIQASNYRASLVPALEVRISAKQKTLKSPKSFLPKDSNVYVIEGTVTIKNVGTSKTSLQMCECAPKEGSEKNQVFVPCKRPKGASWDEKKQCPEGRETKGPIIVSKVTLEGDGMHFTPIGRFWFTRSPLDRGPDKVLTDEIRPKAKDEFEFLATVPEEGMYAFMFASHLDEEELHRMEDAGYTLPPWRLRWYATTFLEVNKQAESQQ